MVCMKRLVIKVKGHLYNRLSFLVEDDTRLEDIEVSFELIR